MSLLMYSRNEKNCPCKAFTVTLGSHWLGGLTHSLHCCQEEGDAAGGEAGRCLCQCPDPLRLHQGAQSRREPGSQAVCTLSDRVPVFQVLEDPPGLSKSHHLKLSYVQSLA